MGWVGGRRRKEEGGRRSAAWRDPIATLGGLFLPLFV